MNNRFVELNDEAKLETNGGSTKAAAAVFYGITIGLEVGASLASKAGLTELSKGLSGAGAVTGTISTGLTIIPMF